MIKNKNYKELLAYVQTLEEKVYKSLRIELINKTLFDTAMEKGYLWSCDLNQKGIATEMDFRGKSLKALMKRANKLNARQVLIVGDNELKENRLILRNMNTKEQISIDMETLIPDLVKILKN